MRFTDPSRRRIGLAYLIGILAGVFGAIVKWGWEVSFPPRNPFVFFPLDAGERVTPPKIFLEQLGLPTDWFYIFSGMGDTTFNLYRAYAFFYCFWCDVLCDCRVLAKD